MGIKEIFRVRLGSVSMLVEAAGAFEAIQVAEQHYNEFIDGQDESAYRWPKVRSYIYAIHVERVDGSFVGGLKEGA